MARTFTKRAGAPAGTITIVVASTTYTIDDGANATITAASDADATGLVQNPNLTEGPGNAVTPTPSPRIETLQVQVSDPPLGGTVPVRGTDGKWTESTSVGNTLRVLKYTSGAYPARPSAATVAPGLVRFVGPTQPTGWLTGDEWVIG